MITEEDTQNEKVEVLGTKKSNKSNQGTGAAKRIIEEGVNDKTVA